MFDYIHHTYQVPAEIGRRVIANGQPGTIVGSRNAYIIVNLDKDEPHVAGAWHPTWEMRYLNEIVEPRAKLSDRPNNNQHFATLDTHTNPFNKRMGHRPRTW